MSPTRLTLIFATALVVVSIGNPALAFFVGCGITLVLGGDHQLIWAKPLGQYLLQTGIVLLGFGIQASALLDISSSYATYVIGYLVSVTILGLVAYRLFRLKARQGILVTGGTAICGGTTVVTLSPIINAEPQETGAVLGLIFAMNALALLTFPAIGTFFELSQAQFGVWSALAIHDTASVVATAQIYGQEAAEVATTLKLGRTLWLIPTVLIFAWIYRRPDSGAQLPLFVLLFVGASLLGSSFELPLVLRDITGFASKICLVFALYMIGLQTSLASFRNIPIRLTLYAAGLWCLVAPLSLLIIILSL